MFNDPHIRWWAPYLFVVLAAISVATGNAFGLVWCSGFFLMTLVDKYFAPRDGRE